MSVLLTDTTIHVYIYKLNQLFQQRATFNYLGKKIRNQNFFTKNLITDQDVGNLGVFNCGSLFYHLACKIVSLNYRTVTLYGHETVWCTDRQCVRRGC